MKRLFDIAFSLIVLTVFFPCGVIIAILIFLTSGRRVFFIQQRVGKDGKPFGLIKFRTMRNGAEKSGKLTVGMRDQRITKIGYVLRKFKLDEFPQFINVLLGDMSVVGPRPEVQEYVNLYTDEQREILKVKPGITDYASIEYYNENEILGKAEDPRKVYIKEVMPAKIALNKKYIDNPGLLHDLKIIWLTFRKMFS